MKQRIVQVSVASISALGAMVGLSSVVSADSISTTGPGSANAIYTYYSQTHQVDTTNHVSSQQDNMQSASTGNVTSSDNTINGGYSGQTMTWGNWNPANGSQNGQDFTSWWNGMMQQIGSCGLQWTTGGNSWTPTGSNWQNIWSNWNPTLWQQNGQSFSSWYGHILPYMMHNYTTWQQGWATSATQGTGNASNSNNTDTSVHITNGNSGQNSLGNTGQSNFGGGTIYMTGPHSTNTTDSSYSSDYAVTNRNNIRTSNSNQQHATSGNVTSSDNTVGGAGNSGSASNGNNSQTGITIVNPTSANSGSSFGGSPSGENGGSGISTTGPGSTNGIYHDVSYRYSSVNTNEVNVSTTNDQYAHSGNVVNSDNTLSGNGMSGNASNTNGSHIVVSL